MKKCRTDENGEGHVFGSPAGDYMTLICFKNGSLAREKIRDAYGIKDWKKFGESMAARRRPATTAAFCCRGSRRKLFRASTSRAFTVLTSTRRMPPRIAAPFSRRR